MNFVCEIQLRQYNVIQYKKQLINLEGQVGLKGRCSSKNQWTTLGKQVYFETIFQSKYYYWSIKVNVLHLLLLK